MSRQLSFAQQVERSIIKTYRKEIWNPFVEAVKTYQLIAPNDSIAVCVSGGKDSMLLAKCMQQLQRFSDFPFTLQFICMDPGYNAANRSRIEYNAERLEIPLVFFETNIFDVTVSVDKNPCYLCARMRRGHLYSIAQRMGCNKIALGHHRSDVVETTLLGMFYGAQLQAMLPRLKSTNFEGMELIRPLYCVNEADILRWKRQNTLEFIQCACRFVDAYSHAQDGIGASKRQEIKALLQTLKESNPDVERNIFMAIHNLKLDTFVSYKQAGCVHSFLEQFEENKEPENAEKF